jgi:hypothetical protein
MDATSRRECLDRRTRTHQLGHQVVGPVPELRSLASREPIRRLAKELIDISMTSPMAGGIDQCQLAS